MFPLVASVLVVAVALGLIVARRGMGLPDGALAQLVVAAALIGLVWMPPAWAAAGVAVATWAVFGWALAALLIAAPVVVLVTQLVPGGVSVVLLGVIVLVGALVQRDHRRRLRRLAAAAQLQPGEHVAREVELTGQAFPLTPCLAPHLRTPCATWTARIGGTSYPASTYVELRAAHGSAIIDPRTVPLQWSRDPQLVRGDDARAIIGAVGAPVGADADPSVLLHVLPVGATCYVVGVPTWALAPGGAAGLYRDSPLLPTFRQHGPDHAPDPARDGAAPMKAADAGPAPIWADQSEEDLARASRFARLVWGAWAVVAGLIAVGQAVAG
ncbi:MAG: hypothetical protein KA297_07920 [Kofleriaceae bacterium]|nr:hypothetical protein [Kofleriaceae bacterium]